MHRPTLAVSALAVATLSSPAQELPLPEAPKPRKVSRFAETNAQALADGTSEKFEHPATFAEFFEREPRYVRNWLKAKKCPWELFEDFEQSLFYHMMRPVTNPDTGEVEPRAVTDTFVHEQVATVRVKTSQGEITTTINHPFYVEGKGWRTVGQLEAGDQLHTPDGTLAEVITIQATGTAQAW